MNNKKLTKKQAHDFDRQLVFLEDIMSWSGGYLPPECEFFKYLEYNVGEDSDDYEFFETFCNDMADDEVKTLQELYNYSPKLKSLLKSSHYTQLVLKLEANGAKIAIDSTKAKEIALKLDTQIKKSLDSLTESDLNDLSRVIMSLSSEVYDLIDKARHNSKAK